MQQLMKKGRTDIQDIDKTLERSERIVEDTKAVGTQVRPGARGLEWRGVAWRGVAWRGVAWAARGWGGGGAHLGRHGVLRHMGWGRKSVAVCGNGGTCVSTVGRCESGAKVQGAGMRRRSMGCCTAEAHGASDLERSCHRLMYEAAALGASLADAWQA